MMRLLDLFAGVGGFTEAVRLARISVSATTAVEWDAPAARTYVAMHGEECLQADVRTLSGRPVGDRATEHLEQPFFEAPSSLLSADIITGGLPCQPHSLMGGRKGAHDARADVFWDYMAIVNDLKPAAMVIENVRAIRSVNDGTFYRQMLAAIEQAGYTVTTWVLDAQHFGVPQVRRRLFIVGMRDGQVPRQPTPVQPRLWPTTWHLLERDVPEKYYLSERIKHTILKDQHKGYRRPALINRLTARPLTRTMHKMHRASQDNYYSNAFINGEFDAVTEEVRQASEGADQIRRITPREAFRIQGFSEASIDRALTSGVSDTQLYMQAGNAVPPPLAAAVLRTVGEALNAIELDRTA